MRALIFVRNLTTNLPTKLDYDYYYYSQQLTTTIDLSKTLGDQLSSYGEFRLNFIKTVIEDLSNFLQKPILPINLKNVRDEIKAKNLTQLVLILPSGEKTIFSTIAKELEILQIKETTINLKTISHTKYYEHLHYTQQYYTPRTNAQHEVFRRLKQFLLEKVKGYKFNRNLINEETRAPTSELSEYLALGVMSFEALMTIIDEHRPVVSNDDYEEFRRQVSWILYCKIKPVPEWILPTLTHEELDAFTKWIKGELALVVNEKITGKVNKLLKSISKGEKPSNRTRLIVSYVLIKVLKLPWQYGELYFRHVLTDYHPQINYYNWYAQNKNRYLSSYNLVRQFEIHKVKP